MTGCTKITEGCDHCYADVLARRFRGPAFPVGFEPMYRPHRLEEPRRTKRPGRWFVNSMSDLHHESFSEAEVDSVYDAMAEVDRHDYLVLTKRPGVMYHYLMGGVGHRRPRRGWLERRGLDQVPAQIWLGATIELDKYVSRADFLREIPCTVRFLSCEPLLGPLDGLSIAGLAWVIVGGESGNGSSKYRPMDYEWARDLRDYCDAANVAFYYKQDAGRKTELNPVLDGVRHEEYPLPHPSTGAPRVLGRYVEDAVPTSSRDQLRLM